MTDPRDPTATPPCTGEPPSPPPPQKPEGTAAEAIPGLSCRTLIRIIDDNPECIVVTDPAGDIVYVNRRFEEVTGYTAAEAIGNNPRILKSGRTPPGTYDELWQTITAGRPWRGRFTNARKNGELYVEDAQITPVQDDTGAITHFVAVKEDITGRVRLEEAVGRLNTELLGILNTIPAWVFFKDRENRFIRVNEAFARDMGTTVGALEGASCFDVFPREQAEDFWKDDLQVITAGVPKEKIVEPVTAADGIRWVQTEKIPLRDATGEIIGIIGFANDITSRKLMEDEGCSASRMWWPGSAATSSPSWRSTPPRPTRRPSPRASTQPSGGPTTVRAATIRCRSAWASAPARGSMRSRSTSFWIRRIGGCTSTNGGRRGVDPPGPVPSITNNSKQFDCLIRTAD